MSVESIHEIVEPLYDKLEKIFPANESYFDLENHKYLRLCLFSDIMLKVIVEFSYDGVNKGLQVPHRSTSMWMSQRIEIPMRYVRFHVINESPHQENHKLVITARLIGGKARKERPKSVHFEEPVVNDPPPQIKRDPSLVEVKDVVEEIKHATRTGDSHKSPFARFRKKGSPAVKSVPIKDQRFPEFLPLGSIPIAGVGNTFKMLGKGADGEFLMMKDGQPCWSLPYPPVKLSEESRKSLAKLEKEEDDTPIPEPWVI